ncbi:hypothetical protein EG328_009325 [Venturia inaequalis]|uniref:Uncharacterized protein n=1 Tax=Venturia inaequalis TaxID=5025 RepID=A0A8H3UAA8_VENIN|nr:hypothetical protein EG328_009325 [Venturia inaequalis]
MDCFLMLGAIGAVGKLAYDVSGQAKHQFDILIDESLLHLKPTATTTWLGATFTDSQPPAPAPVYSVLSVPRNVVLDLTTCHNPGPAFHVVIVILLLSVLGAVICCYAPDICTLIADLTEDYFEETLDDDYDPDEPAIYGQLSHNINTTSAAKTLSSRMAPKSPGASTNPAIATNSPEGTASPTTPPTTSKPPTGSKTPATSQSLATSNSPTQPAETLPGPEKQSLGVTFVAQPESLSPDPSTRQIIRPTSELETKSSLVSSETQSRPISTEQSAQNERPQILPDADENRPCTPRRLSEEVQATFKPPTPEKEIIPAANPSDGTKNALGTGNTKEMKWGNNKARQRVIQDQTHHDIVEDPPSKSHTATTMGVAVGRKSDTQDTSSTISKAKREAEGGAVINLPAKKRSIDHHESVNTIDKPMVVDSKDSADKATDLTLEIEADHTGILAKENENDIIDHEDFCNKDHIEVGNEQAKLESTNIDNHTSVIPTSTGSKDAEHQDSLQVNATDNNATPTSALYKAESDQKARAKEARHPDTRKEANAQRNTGRYGVLSSDSADDDSQPESNAGEVIDPLVTDDKKEIVQNMEYETGNKGDSIPDIPADKKWETVGRRKGRKEPKNAAISRDPSAQAKPRNNKKSPRNTWSEQTSAHSQADGVSHPLQETSQQSQRAPPSTPKEQRGMTPDNPQSQNRQTPPPRRGDRKGKTQETAKNLQATATPPNVSPKFQTKQSTSTSPKTPENSYLAFKAAQEAQESVQSGSNQQLSLEPERSGSSLANSSPKTSNSPHVTKDSLDERPTDMALNSVNDGTSGSTNLLQSVDELKQTKIGSWADDVESHEPRS